MPPVYDQGCIGSCTANAVVAIREYKLHNTVALSRLYLYYKARERRGWQNDDTGSVLRDAMSVLYTNGCATEAAMPYSTDFRAKPSEEAEREAALYRIADYRRLVGLSLLLRSLAKGNPAAFAVDIYESFDSEIVARSGRPPVPGDPRFAGPDGIDDYYGRHAVVAVGYSLPDRILICRNSWSTGWGIEGYFALPFAFFERGYAGDVWTIHP